MAQLRDELLLDVSKTLTEIDRVDKALDKLWRNRGSAPSPVPPVPSGAGGGGGSGSGRSATENQLDRISNRLKAVQQEMNRLGDGATQQQLDAYATRLARLTTQANLLAPGLDQGSRAGARLAGILTGLNGTSERVRVSLDQMMQGPRAPTDPEGLRRLREQIREIGNQVNTTRLMFQSGMGQASQQEVGQLTVRMTALKNQALQLAQGLPAGSKELRQLALAAAQAERTIAGSNGQMSRLGLAAQVKLGVGGALAEAQAFQGPINGLTQMAKFYDQTRVASLLYESQLRRQNLSMEEGTRVVDRLASRLKILPSAAQEGIQVLLRNGFTLQQAYTVLERAGASAVAKGRAASDGISGFTEAIQSQSSAMLAGIGILGNLVDFYYQFAKASDTTASKLTAQQKAQAVVNGVMRETTEELANLETIQASLGGSFSDLATAGQKFQVAFGKTFSGPVGDTVKLLTGVTNVMNSLPRPVADVASRLLVFGGSAFLLAKGVLLVRANVLAMNTQLFGTGAAGAAGAGGLVAYNAQLLFLKQNATTALAQVGALKAGLNILGALAIGVTIGLQINAIDLGEGKGTVGEQIQLKFLELAKQNNLGGKFMRAVLGIDQQTAEEGATQLANDLSGVTKKAEEKYAELAAKGGERYAGLLRLRDNALQKNAKLMDQRRGLTDPQELAGLDRQIALNNKVITSVNQQAAAILKAKAAKSGDVKSTLEQDEAYSGLQDSLKGLSEQFGQSKMTSFQRDLDQARKSFEKFADDIDKAIKKGDVTDAQGKLLKSALSRAQAQVIPDLVTRQIEDNKRTALQGQRELEEGRTALMVEGRKKREAELALETSRLRSEYQTRIDEARQNAGARGLSPDQSQTLNDEAVRLEGERDAKIKLAREKANQDLEQMEREHHKRLLDAQVGAAQAQVQVAEAGLAAVLQAREGDLGRADGNAGRLAVERRYGEQVVGLQRQIAEEKRRIREASLAQDYAEEMRVARDSGEQRGMLELAARQKYGSSLRTLEIETRTQITDAVTTQKQREDEALARLEQRGLDRVLSNLGKITGAELASIKTRLEGRRALALASGNAPLTEALDKAIEGVTGQMVQNAQEFRDRLSESGKEAADLRTQLQGVAQTPLQQAQKSATGPFDAVLKGARKQLDDLQKAYGKVATPTPEQAAEFRSRQKELTGIVTQATAERTTAEARATAKYYRDREDKAQAAHLSLSKRELDLGRLTLDGYARVLEADRAYWQARRDNAAVGSEDRDQADQKLRENEDERLRLANDRRALEKDTASFSREQLQTALELATSERDRAVALERLNASNRQRLSDLDGEIAALEAQGGHERQLLELRRERAGLQKDMATRQRDELEHARALTQSVLDRVDAETKLAEKLARTDAAAAQARQDSIDNGYDRLSELEGRISNPKSEEERNKLLTERLNLLGQIHDMEVAAALAPLAIQREQLDLQNAQAALRLRLLGLSQDEVVVAEDGLRQAEEDLRLAQEKAAVMRQQGTASEQREAETEAVRAEVAVLEARNRLIQAPIVQERQRLGLLQAQGAASLALAGLGDDQLAQAQLRLEGAQRELVVANAMLAVAVERQQTEEALTGQANARAGLIAAENAVLQAGYAKQQEAEQKLEGLRNAQREYARAQVKAAQDLLVASLKQADIQAVISGLADDDVLSAERALDASRQRLELTRELARSPGLAPDDRAALLREEIDLLGEVAEGERKVAAAQRARQTLLEDLALAQSNLRTEIEGGSSGARALAGAQSDLAAARLKVAQAEREYNAAVASGKPEGVKSATEALTSALAGQRSALRGVSESYQTVLNSMKGVQDAGQQLQKAIQGEGEPQVNVNREIDRFSAIGRRREMAISAMQSALRSGDMATITTATRALAEQEERYRKQAELLNKNGVDVSLRDEGTVQALADQVDRLGIEYDREATLVQQRADAASQEAQAAVTFSTAVQLFQETGDSLLHGLQQAAEARLTPEERVRRGEAQNELAQATASLKGAIQQSLGEAGTQFARAAQQASGPPRVAPRSEAQQQGIEAGLQTRFGQDLAQQIQAAITRAAAPVPQAKPPTTPTPQSVNNSRTITHNWNLGGISITQQPGQDAHALADDVVDILQRRADLMGVNCE